MFIDAPTVISDTQDHAYYSLFEDYLKLYEDTLSRYIESMDVSVETFYEELVEIKEDTSVKDKKVVHFVNYLLASTDYPSFYKLMVRAAKKLKQKREADPGGFGDDSKGQGDGGADSKSDAKSSGGGGGRAEGKAEGKGTSDSKDSK
jgi:hypothetical protein